MGSLDPRLYPVLSWVLPFAVAFAGSVYGAFHRLHPLPAYCFIFAGVLIIGMQIPLLARRRTGQPGQSKWPRWIPYLGMLAGIGWILGGGMFLGWF